MYVRSPDLLHVVSLLLHLHLLCTRRARRVRCEPLKPWRHGIAQHVRATKARRESICVSFHRSACSSYFTGYIVSISLGTFGIIAAVFVLLVVVCQHTRARLWHLFDLSVLGLLLGYGAQEPTGI